MSMDEHDLRDSRIAAADASEQASWNNALPLRGYRFMRPDEAERLTHRSPIVIQSGSTIHTGLVKSFGDATMTVVLDISGTILDFDLDDPDLWGDGESRDRRAPMTSGGEFVAIRSLEEAERDLLPELKASVRLGTLEQQMRRVLAYIEERKGVAA